MGVLLSKFWPKETWLAPSCVTSIRNLSHLGARTRRSVWMLSSRSSASMVSRTRRRSGVCVSLSLRSAPLLACSTKDEKDPQRIFEGQALMRRMIRYGILDEDKQRLDYVLELKVENVMERRLQTLVFKRGLAKSIHHARVLIRQRHILHGACRVPASHRVRNQLAIRWWPSRPCQA